MGITGWELDEEDVERCYGPWRRRTLVWLADAIRRTLGDDHVWLERV